MNGKKEEIVRVIKADTKSDIKRHQQLTIELPTNPKAKNPFVGIPGNSKKSDSKKK